MKIKEFLKKLIILATVLSLTPFIQGGCGGGGGGGGGSPPTPSEDVTDAPEGTTDTPLFEGFALSVEEEDFWEFDWDVHTSSVYSGGGSSETTTGSFRITLGPPTTIDGMTAYPMLLSGENNKAEDGTGGYVVPRWSHMAFSGHKICLSDDGTTMKEVFDAMDGTVLGFGFFTALGDDTLFEVGSGTISNDYINESAYVLSRSEDQSRCEYFGSYGTICGGADSDYSITEREYYQAGIGPVGYYKYFGFSSGGTFDSYHTSTTVHIGLTACSLRGDTVDYILDTEPNDSPGTAQLIDVPITLKGRVLDDQDPYEHSTYMTVNELSEAEPNHSPRTAQPLSLPVVIQGDTQDTDPSSPQNVSYPPHYYSTTTEDWYSFSVPADRSGHVRLELDIEGDSTADLDLLLFDNAASTTLGAGLKDNPASNDPIEEIHTTLTPATYLVAVDAYLTPSGRVNYTLDIRHQGSPGSARAIEEWYSFTLTEQTQRTITLTIVDFDNQYDDLDLFLFDDSANVLLGSSLKDNPYLNDPTETVTVILDPGTYLLGVDALWACRYTLTIE